MSVPWSRGFRPFWRRSPFLPLLLLALFLTAEADADPLAVNTFGTPPLSNGHCTGFHDLLTLELFHRLGLEVVIPRLPAGRALINANLGIDDGDLPRIAGLSRLYPNLVRVPESILSYTFVAFTRRITTTTERWDALQPYHVGIVRGWKILEENIVNPRSLIKVKDPTQLFRLLKRDRAEVVVYEQWQGLQIAKDLAIEGLRILSPPLAEREMFLYLHKKHTNLAAKAAVVLKGMKEDGTYQRLFRETLAPLQKTLPHEVDGNDHPP